LAAGSLDNTWRAGNGCPGASDAVAVLIRTTLPLVNEPTEPGTCEPETSPRGLASPDKRWYDLTRYSGPDVLICYPLALFITT
jgi:hypothetical protein